LSEGGGLLTLANAGNPRIDGVAYLGGDPKEGWSTSFAEKRASRFAPFGAVLAALNSRLSAVALRKVLC
jgi:hypothetical protein